MKKIQIAPSILSADFSNLGQEIADIERGGADLIHIDVMDGHFVPNITIGPVVIKWIRKQSKLPLDVHLMIDEPIRYIKEFREAGSDMITVHYEACEHLEETIADIKKCGAEAGISIKPKTPVDQGVIDLLGGLDLVLIMSVEPGFGGQKFMPEVVDKIKKFRGIYKGRISIDGGITAETAPVALNAGVDILVSGTGVFGQSNRTQAIRSLRGK